MNQCKPRLSTSLSLAFLLRYHITPLIDVPSNPEAKRLICLSRAHCVVLGRNPLSPLMCTLGLSKENNIYRFYSILNEKTTNLPLWCNTVIWERFSICRKLLFTESWKPEKMLNKENLCWGEQVWVLTRNRKITENMVNEIALK